MNYINNMKKIFFLCTALFVSMVMLFTSCNREEINNNGNTDDGNQEEPSLEHYLPDAVVDIDAVEGNQPGIERKR